jgi:hypothetical protein
MMMMMIRLAFGFRGRVFFLFIRKVGAPLFVSTCAPLTFRGRRRGWRRRRNCEIHHGRRLWACCRKRRRRKSHRREREK